MPVSRRVHISGLGSSRLATSVLAIAGLLAIVGCSPSATTGPSAAGVATDSPPAVTATGGAGVGSCGEATATLVQQHFASRTDIVSVKADGGCHDLAIVTNLGDRDGATAITICDAASQIAYGPDISSITVTGASTKELATGVMGTDCIGKP